MIKQKKKVDELMNEGGKALHCRHPPCRAIVDIGQAGLFVVSSALATTQGMAVLLEFRIQKLRSRRATNPPKRAEARQSLF